MPAFVIEVRASKELAGEIVAWRLCSSLVYRTNPHRGVEQRKLRSRLLDHPTELYMKSAIEGSVVSNDQSLVQLH